MIFLSDSQSQLYAANYQPCWDMPPLDAEFMPLLEQHNRVARIFYDYIRLHANEKIRASELNDIGVDNDSILKLVLLVQMKQGTGSIEFLQNPDETIIVYHQSQMKASIAA
jgi:hypothetical protein